MNWIDHQTTESAEKWTELAETPLNQPKTNWTGRKNQPKNRQNRLQQHWTDQNITKPAENTTNWLKLNCTDLKLVWTGQIGLYQPKQEQNQQKQVKTHW